MEVRDNLLALLIRTLTRHVRSACLLLGALALATLPMRAATDVTITVTQGGVGVEGALVALVGPNATKFAAVTDAAGRAVFSQVPDGSYVASASAPGTSAGSVTVVAPTDSAKTITVNGSPKVNGVATCKIQPAGVQVSIDSGALQPVNFGANRTDIAAAFPGFSNTDSAGGSFVFDTTALANGVHTIGWLIDDDCGRADGVGSRFFTVQNGSQVATPVGSAFRRNWSSDEPVLVSRGYGQLPVRVGPDAAGARRVRVAPGERIEVRLPRGYEHAHQLVNGERRALPIGASWDASAQIISWQPARGSWESSS